MKRDWMKIAREKKGLTQKELGKISGITGHSIYKYEHGERNPSVKNAKKIAEILDESWIRFFEETE